MARCSALSASTISLSTSLINGRSQSKQDKAVRPPLAAQTSPRPIAKPCVSAMGILFRKRRSSGHGLAAAASTPPDGSTS